MRLAESGSRAQHPRIYAGDEVMRRDDDLIRKLMLDFEAMDEPLLTAAFHLNMSADERRTYYHLKCLADAGLLEEESRGVFRMTSAGHDFCAGVRDDKIWQKTKDAAASVSGVGLAVMKDIAVGYLRAKLKDLGVPLG